jgi:hypothetical protein
MTVIEEATPEGIRVRLVDADIASFAIVIDDGVIYAIAHRTADFACAQTMFKRSVVLAGRGLTHPAWRKSA